MSGDLEDVRPSGALGRDTKLAIDLESLLDRYPSHHALGIVGRRPGRLVPDPIHSINAAVNPRLQPLDCRGVNTDWNLDLDA